MRILSFARGVVACTLLEPEFQADDGDIQPVRRLFSFFRPPHLSVLQQLENSPACCISDLISNNHPTVMGLRYLGPHDSGTDRSDG